MRSAARRSMSIVLIWWAFLAIGAGHARATAAEPISAVARCADGALAVEITARLDGELLLFVEGFGLETVTGPGTFERPAADVGGTDVVLSAGADDGYITVVVADLTTNTTVFLDHLEVLDCSTHDTTPVTSMPSLPSTGAGDSTLAAAAALVVVAGVTATGVARRR